MVRAYASGAEWIEALALLIIRLTRPRDGPVQAPLPLAGGLSLPFLNSAVN